MDEVVHILLVERDQERRRRTVDTLVRAGWEVTEVGSADACLTALAGRPEATVLLGPGALDLDGLLGRLMEDHPGTPVVVTGTDDVGTAIDAMKRGAWDYLVARADLGHLSDLSRVVGRVLERRQLVRERSRLRDEMAVLGAALQRTTDGIAILGPGGRISFVNRALAAAFRAPASAVVGRVLGEFVRVPGDDDGLDDILSAIAAQGHWSGVLQARAGESPPMVWEVSLTPLGGNGHAVPAGRRIIGVFRDVSEKHALEQLRADFLSMVTHDIKVPLTVILGYAEMLGDPEPPPDHVPRDVVARIRESGEQIHALVCNFLDLSRIEAGRFTIDPRPFDVQAMLERAIEPHRPSARRRGIALAIESAPLMAVADEGQLERVVTNLLGNAIKYTSSGGTVQVAVRSDGDRIVLAFADTGRGIPAAEIPHLFERYRRVREAQRTEGTGLGLFIVKTIVDAHGGEIHVDSTTGVGSTFTVVIPSGPVRAPR